jgi:hypothetical protein
LVENESSVYVSFGEIAEECADRDRGNREELTNRYLKDLLRPYFLGELVVSHISSTMPSNSEPNSLPRETFYSMSHLQYFMPREVRESPEKPPDDISPLWELFAGVEPRKYPEPWRREYLERFSVIYDDLLAWTRRNGKTWLIRWFERQGEQWESSASSEPLVRAYVGKLAADAERRGEKLKRDEVLAAARDALSISFSDRALYRAFRDCVPKKAKYGARPSTRQP